MKLIYCEKYVGLNTFKIKEYKDKINYVDLVRVLIDE